MKKYKKQPVVIEAQQFLPQDFVYADDDGLAIWLCHDDGEDRFEILKDDSERRYIEIETMEGTMRAYHGDWIIRGIKGEFYPCKPDIFEETYEAA